MMSLVLVLFLFTIVFTLSSTCTTLAFVQPIVTTTRISLSSPSSPTQRKRYRSTIIVESAKILPIAYTSASAALLFKATKKATAVAFTPTKKSETAVLIAMSALSLINLGPSDSARLVSAKRADIRYPPASSGTAKQQRQSAKTWRSVVRIKLIGQLGGLAYMIFAKSFAAVMRGAAVVFFANAAFFLCGAGRSRHDDDGKSSPMPTGASRAALLVDSIFAAAALASASSPVGSTKQVRYAAFVAFGAVVPAFEGLPVFISGVFSGSKGTKD